MATHQTDVAVELRIDGSRSLTFAADGLNAELPTYAIEYSAHAVACAAALVRADRRVEVSLVVRPAVHGELVVASRGGAEAALGLVLEVATGWMLGLGGRRRASAGYCAACCSHRGPCNAEACAWVGPPRDDESSAREQEAALRLMTVALAGGQALAFERAVEIARMILAEQDEGEGSICHG